MCGISGFIQLNDTHTLTDRQLHLMGACTVHRGPDNQGFFYSPAAGFAHNRLSILDLSEKGNQPMYYNQWLIAFNGEIYNFKALRSELMALGFEFTSGTDTEVVLKAYIAWGRDSFVKLNGIFAFAIYNQDTRETVIVRDRLGVKPLYIYSDNNILLFASEIKSILASGYVSKSINYQALSEYMWFGNPVAAQTIYNGITHVKPGTFVHIQHNKPGYGRYWQPSTFIDTSIREQDAVTTVRQLLEDAVSSQLVSDVPVGVFLSGGIDSSAITAFASKHYHKQLDTYSVEFDYNRGNKSELEKAAMVAKRFRTNHHEMHIDAHHISSIIDLLAYHHDEPFGDAANIPLYLLSKEIKDTTKVVLQGDGGDEIFGGYSYYNRMQHIRMLTMAGHLYKMVHPLARLIKRSAADRMMRFSSAVTQPSRFRQVAQLTIWDSLSKDPYSIFTPEAAQHLRITDIYKGFEEMNGYAQDIDPIAYMHHHDLNVILPNGFLEKVDKSTMANSIEVRVPFLDNHLVEYALRIPSGIKVHKGIQKYLLKQALRGVVPDEILDAPKRGFGVPVNSWLQGKLQPFFKEVMHDPAIVHSGVIDTDAVLKLNEKFVQGKEDNGALLWKTLNLALWYRHYMA
jgi:asparagine synthase (glutamine-hydrolysing)